MAETRKLVDALKRALKAHGRTYADVARALHLSEASVKRLFAGDNLSLGRLEQVLKLLDLRVADLVRMADDGGRPLTELGEAQECEIAADPALLLVAVCVLSGWSCEDMAGYYDLPEPVLVRHLARLDRLRLIELRPRNRIRLRVAPDFRWRTDGPIQRWFLTKVAAEFFASRFDRPTERLLVANGMLSDRANAAFQRRLERLAREFAELNVDEAALPLAERHGTTMVLALRRWQYAPFARLHRRRDRER